MNFFKNLLKQLCIMALLVAFSQNCSAAYQYFQPEPKPGIFTHIDNIGRTTYGCDDAHHIYQLDMPSEGSMDCACGQAALFYAKQLMELLNQNPYATYLDITSSFYDTGYDATLTYIQNISKPGSTKRGKDFATNLCTTLPEIDRTSWLEDGQVLNALTKPELFGENVEKIFYATMHIEEYMAKLESGAVKHVIVVAPQHLGKSNHFITLLIRKCDQFSPIELIVAEGMRWQMLKDLANGNASDENPCTLNYVLNKFVYPANKKNLKAWLENIVLAQNWDVHLDAAMRSCFDADFKSQTEEKDFKAWIVSGIKNLLHEYKTESAQTFLSDPYETDMAAYKKLHTAWSLWCQNKCDYQSRISGVRIPAKASKFYYDQMPAACSVSCCDGTIGSNPAVLPCGLMGIHELSCCECTKFVLNGHFEKTQNSYRCGICDAYVTKEFKDLFDRYTNASPRENMLFQIACARFHDETEESRIKETYFKEMLQMAPLTETENEKIELITKEIALAQELENIETDIHLGGCHLPNIINGSEIESWQGEKSDEYAVKIRSIRPQVEIKNKVLQWLRKSFFAEITNPITRSTVKEILLALGQDIENSSFVENMTNTIFLIRLCQLGGNDFEIENCLKLLGGIQANQEGIDILLSLCANPNMAQFHITEDALTAVSNLIYNIITRNINAEFDSMLNQLTGTDDPLSPAQIDRINKLLLEISNLPSANQHTVYEKYRTVILAELNQIRTIMQWNPEGYAEFESEFRFSQMPTEIYKLPEDLRKKVQINYDQIALCYELIQMTQILKWQPEKWTPELELRLTQFPALIKNLPKKLRADLKLELDDMPLNKLKGELNKMNDILESCPEKWTPELESRFKQILTDIHSLPRELFTEAMHEYNSVKENKILGELNLMRDILESNPEKWNPELESRFKQIPAEIHTLPEKTKPDLTKLYLEIFKLHVQKITLPNVNKNSQCQQTRKRQHEDDKDNGHGGKEGAEPKPKRPRTGE